MTGDFRPDDPTLLDNFYDFAEMASKGLYSYGAVNENWQGPSGYYRITKPRRPFPLANMPANIREVLEKYLIRDVDFTRDATIARNQLGRAQSTRFTG